MTGVLAIVLSPLEARAQTTSAGFPFTQVWNGFFQPPHESPITPLIAFSGPGLAKTRRPGRASHPVLPFLPRIMQHRDAGPWPILPMINFDRSMAYMPYRTDNVRYPKGDLGGLQNQKSRFKLAGGYAGPANTFQGFGQASVSTDQVYARAFAAGSGATNERYDDGSGDTVPYEYDLNSQSVVLGWTPVPEFEAYGVFIRNDINDDRTPSARLDSIETDRLSFRGGFEWRNVSTVIDRIHAYSRIRNGDRRNNNFDIRDFTPEPGVRRQEVHNDRQFIDGRLFADIPTGAFEHRVGMDWNLEHRNGKRYSDSNPLSPDPQLNIVTARQFPDIDVTTFGPTWEGAYSIGADDHLKFGANYRYVHADAGAANRTLDAPFNVIAPGIPATADNLYKFYYGDDTRVEQTDHLVNARANYEHQELDDRLSLFVDVAHIQRAPDSKERYWAVMAPPPQAENRLVGNPDLDPSKDTRINIGATFHGTDWIKFGRSKPQRDATRDATGAATGDTIQLDAWRVAGGLRFSRVHDFITRDSARGQSGIEQDDLALVFRNVDVNIFTAELDTQWNVTPNISAHGNLIYTYAENTSDDRPLYGISPLEGNMLIDYHDRIGSYGNWNVGAKLRLVAAQDRVDDDPTTGSGFDQGDTSAFTVLDFYAGAQLYDSVALRVGVENVLDASYQQNVARTTLDARQRLRIKAPGRSAFVLGIVSF